jgi:hypothetical protein
MFDRYRDGARRQQHDVRRLRTDLIGRPPIALPLRERPSAGAKRLVGDRAVIRDGAEFAVGETRSVGGEEWGRVDHAGATGWACLTEGGMPLTKMVGEKVPAHLVSLRGAEARVPSWIPLDLYRALCSGQRGTLPHFLRRSGDSTTFAKAALLADQMGFVGADAARVYREVVAAVPKADLLAFLGALYRGGAEARRALDLLSPHALLPLPTEHAEMARQRAQHPRVVYLVNASPGHPAAATLSILSTGAASSPAVSSRRSNRAAAPARSQRSQRRRPRVAAAAAAAAASSPPWWERERATNGGPTPPVHIIVAEPCCSARNWALLRAYRDGGSRRAPVHMTWNGSLTVPEEVMLGAGDTRYLPDRIGGNLVLRHDDNNHALGDGTTRYLPEVVRGDLVCSTNHPLGRGATTYLPAQIGGNLELHACNQPLGDGKTTYLPAQVGGGLYLPSCDQPLGDGPTSYLPGALRGPLVLSRNNQPLGRGRARYLPDTVGGDLDLRRNTQPLGHGSTTRYLPRQVGGALTLAANEERLGFRTTSYLPDAVGGTLDLGRSDQPLGYHHARYLPKWGTLAGGLILSSSDQPLGYSTTRYLPSACGHLDLSRNNQPLGDHHSRYLPDAVNGDLLLSSNNQVRTSHDHRVRYLPPAEQIAGRIALPRLTFL